MLFKKELVAVIWTSLNVDAKGQPKTFALSQLKDASEILAQIKEKCVAEDDKFKDGELDFNTDQKKLIRDCCDREWSATVGLDVISVREMLA